MSSLLRTVEENLIRKKNPLSVILERSSEDGSAFDVTDDSRTSEIPERDRPQRKKNKEMTSLRKNCQKQPELNLSDSEFCSSNTAIDLLAKDEAERLLFHNSKLDSFLADASSFNASTKVTEESIGAYFQRRSSNPIKEKGRDASYFQETSEWAESSGFLQPTSCEASTPKPLNSSFRSISQRTLSLSAILQGVGDRPRRCSQNNSRHSSMLQQDPNGSLLQGLQDTNGSICSMARIFSGPDASKLGSQDMMTQVLQYCQARSILADSSIGESFFDSSRYSEFRENLQQDDESSATSKSTNTSEGSPNETILGPVSPAAAQRQPDTLNNKTITSVVNGLAYPTRSTPAAKSESITISATNTLTYVIPQPPKTTLHRGDGRRRPKPEITSTASNAKNTNSFKTLADDHNQNIPCTTNSESLQFAPKPELLSVSTQSSDATTVHHTTSESEKHFPYPCWNMPFEHAQAGTASVGMQPQTPFPPYGFPFVIQIQCPCHHDQHQQNLDFKNRNYVQCSQSCANCTSHTTKAADPEVSMDSAAKRNYSYQTTIVKQEEESFDCSRVGIPPTSPPSEVPNIRVDKAIVAFAKTRLGELRTAILTIQNKSDFNVYLDCGVRKSQDPCFWNYSENTAPNFKTSVKLILHKFGRKSLTIAFQPTREGQVLGNYIIKFQKAESDSDDYATIYKTEVQLTGMGVAAPPRPINTKPKLLSKHPWC